MVSPNEHKILEIVSSSQLASQRELADRSGLSLGMVNMVLKRLAKTGYIKISNLNQRKMHYILTAKGVSEMSRRSYTYLLRTFRVYQQYRSRMEELVDGLIEKRRTKFVVAGDGDVADLMKMILKERNGAVSFRPLNGSSRVKEDEVLLDCQYKGAPVPDGVSVLEEILKTNNTVPKGEFHELV